MNLTKVQSKVTGPEGRFSNIILPEPLPNKARVQSKLLNWTRLRFKVQKLA
jgi:hypothetical protein